MTESAGESPGRRRSRGPSRVRRSESKSRSLMVRRVRVTASGTDSDSDGPSHAGGRRAGTPGSIDWLEPGGPFNKLPVPDLIKAGARGASVPNLLN